MTNTRIKTIYKKKKKTFKYRNDQIIHRREIVKIVTVENNVGTFWIEDIIFTQTVLGRLSFHCMDKNASDQHRPGRRLQK